MSRKSLKSADRAGKRRRAGASPITALRPVDVRGARLYYLQAFRPVNCLDRGLENARPYNPDQMRELCRRAARHVQRCVVRGDQASELAATAVRSSC